MRACTCPKQPLALDRALYPPQPGGPAADEWVGASCGAHPSTHGNGIPAGNGGRGDAELVLGWVHQCKLQTAVQPVAACGLNVACTCGRWKCPVDVG
jgi:hypothetical protein